ncbi:MAG TPA: RNA polymerase factor sigma-54 [Methyloceanibacter sp.]|nr:RNA polymerase factor sigma-54 [Methyloceanibacter sp.]
MAINTKLELRQTHSLVMTPQLQQAIKLLQLSNMELSTFVEGELERNPLLERDDAEEQSGAAGESPAENGEAKNNSDAKDAKSERDAKGDSDAKSDGGSESGESDDWVDLEKGNDSGRTEDLDADPQDMFPDAENFTPGAITDSGWSGLTQGPRADVEEGTNLEAYVAEQKTLRDHLTDQLVLAFSDPAQRLIGQHIIDMTDEAGYLRGELDVLAELLGAPLELVEETLAVMQGFEPCGVFARDLRECLTLQLKEQDRCDPAMAALIENLHLLATHDLVALKRAARVSDEDLCDMIAEVKRLNPKPGLKYGTSPSQPIVPDVLIRSLPDGSFHVELNSETLPRVLVNQSYYATVSKSALRKEDKSYLVDCLQTANWLVKSLDQRARTILKVAQEIVRQQDGFFTYGVRHLRPLNLKTVADAISMHESTVSRVTANKYMATNRGLFELKYFFTSAIAATANGDFHSSEAVRHRIREMIDAEAAADVLSDDKIVERLKADGIDIARRTVAKYREALRIPSSVQRRRLKRIATGASA